MRKKTFFSSVTLLLLLMAASSGKDLTAQVLWGLTPAGGSNNLGNIFSIDVNGQNFNERYAFSSHGSNPDGQHVLDYGDGYLYAVATMPYGGILYRMRPDGTNYQIVYKFTDLVPETGLVKGPDGYLYGSVRPLTGSYSKIYKISNTGAGYQVLHSFSGTDGDFQFGELLLFNGSFYGVTYQGGSDNAGVMYTIKQDGTGFTIIHQFSFTSGTGHYPQGSPAVMATKKGNFLYGTAYGGLFGNGVLYQINIADNNYKVLYNFASVVGRPSGRLLNYGNSLYGTCQNPGGLDGGKFFSYNTISGSFTVLHTFAASSPAENTPTDDILNINNVLYGSTEFGGPNYKGVLYKINPDGTGYQVIYNQLTDANSGFGSLSFYYNQIYGIAKGVTENSNGGVYKINTDGSGFTQIHDFNSPGGYTPAASLIHASDGNLYGLTTSGGNAYKTGVAFSIKTDGTGYTPIVALDNLPGRGSPLGSLIQASNGNLYGMNPHSGTAKVGSVFKLTIAPSLSYTQYGFCFTSNCPGNPVASLLQAADGNLYGMTPSSYAINGTIFKTDLAVSNISIIYTFPGGVGSTGSLIQSTDGYLYGLTQNGGLNNRGAIFKLHTDGTGFQNIFSFGNGSLLQYGVFPNASVVEGIDGKLYGMTSAGGTSGLGAIFRINKDGTGLQLLSSCNASTGGAPLGNLIQDRNTGVLYGTTSVAGAYNFGTVFKLNPDGTSFIKLLDFNGVNGKNPKGDLLLLSNAGAPLRKVSETSNPGIITTNDDIAVTVAPNPAADICTIYFHNKTATAIGLLVTDIYGKVMYQNHVSEALAGYSKQIDLSGYPAGMYLAKIMLAGKQYTKKILKQ